MKLNDVICAVSIAMAFYIQCTEFSMKKMIADRFHIRDARRSFRIRADEVIGLAARLPMISRI